MTTLMLALIAPAHAADLDLTGPALFRDAGSHPDGSAAISARPAGQDVDVFVELDARGSYHDVDPLCSLASRGELEGEYGAVGEIDRGLMFATMSSSDASFWTSLGCELGDPRIGLAQSITVRAELEATVPNCDAYCAAYARAEAEAICGVGPDAATCWAEEESAAMASCTLTCEDEAYAIVGETTLDATQLANANEYGLRAGALTRLRAELSFDHMEDASGDEIE